MHLADCGVLPLIQKATLSRGPWGCRQTDEGLEDLESVPKMQDLQTRICNAHCLANLPVSKNGKSGDWTQKQRKVIFIFINFSFQLPLSK